LGLHRKRTKKMARMPDGWRIGPFDCYITLSPIRVKDGKAWVDVEVNKHTRKLAYIGYLVRAIVCRLTSRAMDLESREIYRTSKKET